MLDITSDIQSLTTFRRRSGDFMKQLKKTKRPVVLTVNGKAAAAQVDPRTLLVQYLRENLRLTGTHVGCDTSQCGACVVHVDGRASLLASCELDGEGFPMHLRGEVRTRLAPNRSRSAGGETLREDV